MMSLLANSATTWKEGTSSESAKCNSEFIIFNIDLHTDDLTEDPSLPSEKTEISQVLSIFPRSPEYLSPSTMNATHLQWYGRWLGRQLENMPPFIINRIECFSTVFLEIAKFAKIKS